MEWFNLYGLLLVLVMLIPNMVFALTRRGRFQNHFQNKTVLLLEQAGRFGCMGFMTVQIPPLCLGFWFSAGRNVYLVLGGILLLLYLLGWIFLWNAESLKKAILLSILPSLLFLESAILTGNFPLLAAASLFAPCHVAVSFRNAVFEAKKG